VGCHFLLQGAGGNQLYFNLKKKKKKLNVNHWAPISEQLNQKCD